MPDGNLLLLTRRKQKKSEPEIVRLRDTRGNVSTQWFELLDNRDRDPSKIIEPTRISSKRAEELDRWMSSHSSNKNEDIDNEPRGLTPQNDKVVLDEDGDPVVIVNQSLVAGTAGGDTKSTKKHRDALVNGGIG